MLKTSRSLSDAIDFINDKITVLEDDLQHEECVEHDKVRAFFIKAELDNYKNVLECLGNEYKETYSRT